MKTKMIFFMAVVLLLGAGIYWLTAYRPFASINAGDRKPLYYTCSMHPWVRESKSGRCSICGMNLAPVSANGNGAATTNATLNSSELMLDAESIRMINVQTDLVQRRPVRRTLHVSGQFVRNSAQEERFDFTTYQRDLEWLKIGRNVEIILSRVPDKIFTVEIKVLREDKDFMVMARGATASEENSNPPVEVGDLGKEWYFNRLYAEALLVAQREGTAIRLPAAMLSLPNTALLMAETEPTLTVPRRAVISRGLGALVYVDEGNGLYAPRSAQLGRVGDEVVEVLAGLKEGEKVVTTGSVLIDSEAQLSAGQ